MSSIVDTGVAVSDPARDRAWTGERIAFWAAVGLILVFSQCWVMPFTGPGPDPIDPAVSASIRNYYYPFYLLTLVLAASRARQVALALLGAPALAALLALTFVSLAWTIDPDVTLRRAVAELFTALAGVVIAERFPWPRFLEVFATGFGVVMVLCFLFIFVAPTYGRMLVEFPGVWRGVYGHKNLLGYNMSVAFVVFAAAALANPKRRWLCFAGMAGAFVLMIGSQSKTSLVSCLIGAACIPLVAMARRGPIGKVIATWLGLMALVALSFLVFAAPDHLLALVGKDATLTGRTQIWEAVMRQIQLRPLTGYGYAAVWDNPSRWGPLPWISKEQGFVIHEAHNTWLGIWLELGLVGLVCWTLLFVGVWARAVWSLYFRPAAACFGLAFLTVFSLHTVTETAALMQNDLIWLIFTAVAAKLALSAHAPASAGET